MSKLYGYLAGDASKSYTNVTRSGNNWIESILQTSFVRVRSQMDDKGETTVLVYRCHGRDNQGECLAGIVIDKDGTVKVTSQKTNP